MEWSKAKNVILLMLIAVNIILFVTNIYKKETNSVNDDRVANITNICRSKDISISCDIPKDITPTAQLAVRDYDFDYVKLQQIFFGTISGVKRSSDVTSVIFTRNDERLVVENSRIIFTSPKKEYTTYVDGIKELLGDFDVERKTQGSVYYFQSYRDMPIFSNYICVDTSGDNIAVTVNYSKALNPIGSKKTIIGADEALYGAISYICEDIEGQRTITLIEKGYYDSRTTLSEDGTIPPVYAIYVNDRVYFVNAYTGSCYK